MMFAWYVCDSRLGRNAYRNYVFFSEQWIRKSIVRNIVNTTHCLLLTFIRIALIYDGQVPPQSIIS